MKELNAHIYLFTVRYKSLLGSKLNGHHLYVTKVIS